MATQTVVVRIDTNAPSPSQIHPDVDLDARRAVYFRQLRSGLFVWCGPASLGQWIRSIPFLPDRTVL